MIIHGYITHIGHAEIEMSMHAYVCVDTNAIPLWPSVNSTSPSGEWRVIKSVTILPHVNIKWPCVILVNLPSIDPRSPASNRFVILWMPSIKHDSIYTRRHTDIPIAHTDNAIAFIIPCMNPKHNDITIDGL